MFIKHDTHVAKYIAGAGLVDEPGWVVTGVSDEDADSPGFVSSNLFRLSESM